MRTKIWIVLVALIVAISAIAYALYLVLQVKTDAEMMVEDYQDIQKHLANEEATKMAEGFKGPAQPSPEESGAGEGNLRP